jgi:hypothetical protein
MSHFEITRMKAKVDAAQKELAKARDDLERAIRIVLTRPGSTATLTACVRIQPLGDIEVEVSDGCLGIQLPTEAAQALGGFLIDLYGYQASSGAYENARFRLFRMGQH